MATIEKTEHGTYRVRYRDPVGGTRSKSFKRRADADAFANRTEVAKLDGAFVDQQFGRVQFGEWAESWQRGRLDVASATRVRDESVLRSLVLLHFANRRLASITPASIRDWVAGLDQAGYAANTIRKAYQLMAAVLEAAVTDGLIPKSPCRKIRLPKIEREEMRFLNADEVTDLASAIDRRYRALVFLAASTGLRWGEATGLTIDRLHLLKRELTVAQTLSEVRGRVEIKPTTKTAAARRTVSLPAFLVEDLSRHITEYPGPHNLVFTSAEGDLLRRTNFRRRVWLPAVRESVGEPMRFHDLRHTHVAQLIAAGEHVTVIQQRLGHASISTTINVYGHLLPGLDEGAAGRIDALYRNRSVSEMCQKVSGQVVSLPHQ